MDGRPTWTDCDEAGDYVVPNVLSPRDLVFRPDNMDETVPHITINLGLNIFRPVQQTKPRNKSVIRCQILYINCHPVSLVTGPCELLLFWRLPMGTHLNYQCVRASALTR